MRYTPFLAVCSFGFLATAQCPEFTQSIVTPLCKPDCELCQGDKLTIQLFGNDLPSSAKVVFYASDMLGFNPYHGEGEKIGFANINTSNPPCRICPQLQGFLIDACGSEADNEFMIIWTGSGFNTSDFRFDYSFTNNIFGATNADIGPGGCSIISGNPGLISGCNAIPIGNNYNLPANSIWILFASAAASTQYDFTTVCGLSCKIFVSSSSCDRTIGCFSNYDASPGIRTQIMSIANCSCATTAVYDIPGFLTGQGDYWAEGTIVNTGCATPAFNSPDYTPGLSKTESFEYKIPATWCNHRIELVGVLDPEPDINCCDEIFSDRILFHVNCPEAYAAQLKACDTGNNKASFILEDANLLILNGNPGSVEFFSDPSGFRKIYSPYYSSSSIVYARVKSGLCYSSFVPLQLEVLKLPVAKPASMATCEQSKGQSDFNLDLLKKDISSNVNFTVKFYTDPNKRIEITSPYTSASTIVYASVDDGFCESKTVPVSLQVLEIPQGIDTLIHYCAYPPETINLQSLSPGLFPNQPGLLIEYFSDELLASKAPSQFTLTIDTLYARAWNGFCSSDPVRIYFSPLIPELDTAYIELQCGDRNGYALFDFDKTLKSLLKVDSALRIQFYKDPGLTKTVDKPAQINGTDTVYIKASKDSCSEKSIPLILKIISPPDINTFRYKCCATSDSAWFDLDSISRFVCVDTNQLLEFAMDSVFLKPIKGRHLSATTTIFARSSIGNCYSDTVEIILEVIRLPEFQFPDTIRSCDHYILPEIKGRHISKAASYRLFDHPDWIPFNAGDTLFNNKQLFLLDSNQHCLSLDSLYLKIYISPNAGNDIAWNICEGNLLNLNKLITKADTTGKFYCLPDWILMPDPIIETSFKSGQTLNYAYVLDSNAVCQGDTAIIRIEVFRELSAGADYAIQICESDSIPIDPKFQSGAHPGGTLSDSLNTGALLNGYWYGRISGPGIFTIKYEVGDDSTCPKDRSWIHIEVLPEIQIAEIADVVNCNYYILPEIKGKYTGNPCAYFSTPAGTGKKMIPGDTVFRNTILYIICDAPGYCSEQDTLEITVPESTESSFKMNELCPDYKFNIGQNIYDLHHPTGLEILAGANAMGCDSIVRIELNYLPESFSIITDTLCYEDSVMVHGNLYTKNHPAGTIILSAATKSGCDSTINIDLTFMPEIISYYSDTLCHYESFTLNGSRYSRDHVSDIEYLQSSLGCDSIVFVELYFYEWDSMPKQSKTITEGESIKLEIKNSKLPASIWWSPEKGLNCTACHTPVASPGEYTSYTATMTDEHGCITTAQFDIHVKKEDTMVVANAFSPNGDNVNDLFRLVNGNPNTLITEFSIYDRWGNLVYIESATSLEKHHGWDGRNTSGKMLNPGVYIYYIRTKTPAGKIRILKGDVTLIK